MSRTTSIASSQTVLIPLLAEVYDFKHITDLDYTDKPNYPAIDLADDEARVAIQVTATSDSNKIKTTLQRFMQYQMYERYDRLIFYILTEKKRYYSKQSYDAIIQDRFPFDPSTDIWDYRDMLSTVVGFQIDRAKEVHRVLDLNFGIAVKNDDRIQAAATFVRLGEFEKKH